MTFQKVASKRPYLKSLTLIHKLALIIFFQRLSAPVVSGIYKNKTTAVTLFLLKNAHFV